MSSFIDNNSTLIRNANLDDIDQLIHLRKILLSSGTGHYVAKTPEEELAWQNNYHDWLVKELNSNPRIHIIVICFTHSPDKILSCAIGIIDERVPFNGCLNGKMGWVQTVVVDPQYRGQGLAEQMMEYLFNWFRDNQVGKITLQTTKMAAPLYKKLEFFDSGEPLLIKTL